MTIFHNLLDLCLDYRHRQKVVLLTQCNPLFIALFFELCQSHRGFATINFKAMWSFLFILQLFYSFCRKKGECGFQFESLTSVVSNAPSSTMKGWKRFYVPQLKTIHIWRLLCAWGLGYPKSRWWYGYVAWMWQEKFCRRHKWMCEWSLSQFTSPLQLQTRLPGGIHYLLSCPPFPVLSLIGGANHPSLLWMQ